MAMIGFWKNGVVALTQLKMPKIAPARSPTIGPSSTAPRIAGTCMIVAEPERFGTGMKPRRVTPRKIAIAPRTPATTILRVLKAPGLSNCAPIAATFVPPSQRFDRTRADHELDGE